MSLMSTWPPVESKIRLPVEVSIVLAALPTRTLFAVRDVAEATPRLGVVKDGDVAKTKAPLPVSSVTAAAKLAEDGVAKNVATLAARPDTPVEIGRPVQLVKVPDVGVPNNGVVRVGEVANTKSPLPVSSVTAAAKLADEGVAKKVATLAAKPETPVEIGKPVQLVRVPEEGVPKAGVTRTGDVANTKAPLPVSSDIRVANCKEVVAAKTLRLLPVVVKVPAVGNVTLVVAVVVKVKLCPPEVAKVELFARVSVATVAGAVKATLLILVAVATPKTGVTRVGVLANTKAPVPVSSVTAVIKLADDGVAKNVATPAPKPETPLEIGRPVQLVRVPEVGVPNNGVVRDGEVANTKSPVPVSSVTAVIKLADDGVAKNVATPAPKPDTPLEIGRPVQLVRVPEPGVPNTGVMKVGVLLKTNNPLPLSSDITPANSEEEVAACTDNLSVVTTSVLLVGIVVELIVPETVALEYTSVLVDGLYVSSASDDKATPAPVDCKENATE